MNTVLAIGSRKVPAYGSIGGYCVEAFSRFTGSGLVTGNMLEGVDGVDVVATVDMYTYLTKDASWNLFDGVAKMVLAKKEDGAALALAEMKVQNLKKELYSVMTSNVTEVARNQAIENIYRRLRGV